MSNVDQDESRRREFFRQKERLEMLSQDAERKPVSAENMIQNLLEDVATFQKLPSDVHGLPLWIIADSPHACQHYETIWSYVKGTPPYADTPRVFQLLLTSNLHPDILGFIWNLTNKTTPGQLTKQEFFLALGLVALAQAGQPFQDLSILKTVSKPPIPILTVSFLTSTAVAHQPQPKEPVEDEFQDFQAAEDDFTDFQSALPSIIPTPSQIKVSPESERRLRNLTQQESLSNLPESKISTQNTVSSLPTIEILGIPPKKAKPRKQSPPVAAMNVNDLFPKCYTKSSKLILKETKIPAAEADVDVKILDTAAAAAPLKVINTNTSNDLLTLDDKNYDKYGALRELDTKSEEIVAPVEEFSDFFSAAIPEEEIQAWTTWNSSVEYSVTENHVEGSVNHEVTKEPESTAAIVTVAPVVEDDFGEFTSPVVATENPLPLLDSAEIHEKDLLAELDPLSHLESNEQLILGLADLSLGPDLVAEKCLKCCKNLLEEAVLIMKNVSGKPILEEVFSTDKAKSYLKYLRIVRIIAERVALGGIGDPEVLEEIESFGLQLENLAKEFHVPVEEWIQSDLSGSPCRVCRCVTSSEDIQQHGVFFHVACANLWINCIDTTLPCY